MNYSAIAARATKALTKYGQTVTVRQQAIGVDNDATSVTTLATPVERSVKGLLTDFIYRTFGEESIQGSMVQAGDKRLFMSVGVVPTVKDTIIVDSVEYRIVNIKQINPAGVPVLYDIWLRR